MTQLEQAAGLMFVPGRACHIHSVVLGGGAHTDIMTWQLANPQDEKQHSFHKGHDEGI